MDKILTVENYIYIVFDGCGRSVIIAALWEISIFSSISVYHGLVVATQPMENVLVLLVGIDNCSRSCVITFENPFGLFELCKICKHVCFQRNDRPCFGKIDSILFYANLQKIK